MKLSKVDEKGVPVSAPEDMGVIVRRLGISAPPEVAATLEYLKSIGYIEVEPSLIPTPPDDLIGKCRVELDVPVLDKNGIPTRTYKFVPIEQTEIDFMASRNRAKRDKALKTLVDPINAVRWAAMTPEQQQAWIDYRDALLNITTQKGWPANIVWPTIPA